MPNFMVYKMADSFSLADPSHFNIGNIQIELTSDDFDMSDHPPGPNGGPTRCMLYWSYF
jgi:hypothetical protein